MRFRSPLTVALLVVAGCAPEQVEGTVIPGFGSQRPAVKTPQVPLLGGTVTLAGGGDFAVVSDPERDRIHVVDVVGRQVTGRISLPPGSQPTRGVEDGRGNVRVVLRGTGQVATVRVASATLARTESVCPEPRGIAWDPGQRAAIVACAGGELVTIPSEGSIRVRRLDAELRDVMVVGGRVRVSTFRSAELLTLGEEGEERRVTPPSNALPPVNGAETAFTPGVAWRTLTTPSGQTVMIHQRRVEGDIDAIRTGLPPVPVPYYRNPCDSTIVRTAVTVLEGDTVVGSAEVRGVVPVDAAVSPTGELLIASAGSEELVRWPLSSIQGPAASGVCGVVNAAPPPRTEEGLPTGPLGVPVGVVAVSAELALVHSRDPNALFFVEKGAAAQRLDLSEDRLTSPGFQLFHASTGGIACASCHPEGQEDGHTWTFFGKKKRTQALSGGLRQTAPYHWEGDLSTMHALVSDTFVARMGGAMPDAESVASLEAYLDAIPAPRPPTRATPVDMGRGRAAFVKAGCDSCHRGASLTSATNSNVGTGGSWQTPSLKGVAMRGPWMHDGCAKSLAQRFSDPACGGTKHGDVKALSPTELDELVAYLGQL
jgi:hypothetical protein